MKEAAFDEQRGRHFFRHAHHNIGAHSPRLFIDNGGLDGTQRAGAATIKVATALVF
jgi:hypothetical protein